MPTYGFTITEHDAAEPWIVLQREHRTVELDAGVNFNAWARERWPDQRFTIELDPWQSVPDWR